MRWHLLLALGWMWPFVVALFGVAAIASGLSLRSDGEAMLLFAAAILGSPAVFITLGSSIPSTWSDDLRYGLALVMSVPIVGTELILALLLLANGANMVGPGWIE